MTSSKTIALDEKNNVLDELDNQDCKFHLIADIYNSPYTIHLYSLASKRNANIKKKLIDLNYKETPGKNEEVVYKTSIKYDLGIYKYLEIHSEVYLLDESEEDVSKIAKILSSILLTFNYE